MHASLTIALGLIGLSVAARAKQTLNPGCMRCECSQGCKAAAPDCCLRYSTDTLRRLSVSVDCQTTPGHSAVEHDPQHPHHQTQPPGNSSSPINGSEGQADLHYRLEYLDDCAGFHLAHVFSCLRAAPEDVCDYPEIRAVTMYYNRFAEFPDLSCLRLLAKLDLSHNRLQEVPEKAFQGFHQFITEIYLESNEISLVHAEAFAQRMPRLTLVNLSYNRLTALDSSVFLGIHHPFCLVDLSHNQLSIFTSVRKRQLSSVQYGPGFVDVSYNNLTHGPTELMGFLNAHALPAKGSEVKVGFDFRNNPFHCDCTLHGLSQWYRQLPSGLWYDYDHVMCRTPVSLRDAPLVDVPSEQLTCPLSRGCPPACRCLRQPSDRSVAVDCSDVTTMTALPTDVPVVQEEEEEMLVLSFTNALSIRRLEKRDYLQRTRLLDMRNSGLQVINGDVAELLTHARVVDLRDNGLSRLPDTLRTLSPSAVLLHNNPLLYVHTGSRGRMYESGLLECSCDLRWLRAWLSQVPDDPDDLGNVTCNGTVLLARASDEDLGCPPQWTVQRWTSQQVAVGVGGAAGAVVVVAVGVVGLLLAVRYRYELLVAAQIWAARRAIRKRQQQQEHQQQRRLKHIQHPAIQCPPLANHQLSQDGGNRGQDTFDVFVILHPNCSKDAEWVKSVLLPLMDDHGLSPCISNEDCPPGSVEMDKTTGRLRDSGAALVVLSPDFLSHTPCYVQFRQAYSHMVARQHGPLLLFVPHEVPGQAVAAPRHLNAMLTLGMFYRGDREDDIKALLDLLVQRKSKRLQPSHVPTVILKHPMVDIV